MRLRLGCLVLRLACPVFPSAPAPLPPKEQDDWRGPNPRFRPALESAWPPYLERPENRDAALLAVMKIVGR